MRSVLAAVAPAAAFGILLLASCSDGGGSGSAATVETPSATASTPAETAPTVTTPAAEGPLDGCATERDGRIVRIPVPGAKLDGIVIGRGPVGVVLAHQRGADLCDWLPYAKHLARLGFRSIAFDFQTYAADLVDSVVGAARELRRDGARRLVLVGASMGGTAVLDAASRVPDVVGVVSASGPAVFGDADALRAVRTLGVPVLFLVARDDEDFVGDARTLYRNARPADKALHVLPGFAHGNGFYGAPVGGPAVRLTDRFLAEHAG